MEEEKKGQSAAAGNNHRSVIDTNAPGKGAMKQNGKSPTFLGVSIECDPQYQRKLSSVFVNAFKQAGEPEQMINDFKNMIRQEQAMNPWKFPNSHHVTTLFIGGNQKKLQ